MGLACNFGQCQTTAGACLGPFWDFRCACEWRNHESQRGQRHGGIERSRQRVFTNQLELHQTIPEFCASLFEAYLL